MDISEGFYDGVWRGVHIRGYIYKSLSMKEVTGVCRSGRWGFQASRRRAGGAGSTIGTGDTTWRPHRTRYCCPWPDTACRYPSPTKVGRVQEIEQRGIEIGKGG